MAPPQNPDRLLAATDLRATAGGIEVELPDLLVDLDSRDAQRLHAGGIELDADLTIDTATARHLRDAGDTEQPLRDGVVHEPGELLLGQGCRIDGVVRDSATVDVFPLDDGLLDAIG